jgi:uncharacterized protein (TIGR02246 family)
MSAATQIVENAGFDAKAATTQLGQVFSNMVQAWNRHDVPGYVAAFAEDVDFVNVIGRHLHSRTELEKELSWLHNGVFRNSELRIQETHVRFINPNVAVCPLHWEMRGHESLPGHAFAEVRNGVLTTVLQRDGEQWVIAAAQNTDFVELPGLGPGSMPDRKMIATIRGERS